MTRGKEVQDFIKENKKTARQMFEDVGFKLVKNNAEQIIYRNQDKWVIVDFYLCEKEVSVSYGIDITPFDMETLKLIIAQCKELGWL